MTASKLVLNASSGVGGAGLDVDEVFNTFLYEATGDTSYNAGNGSDNAINNGIDLSGEGGLVWIKSREHSNPVGNYDTGHFLYDTVRGAGKYIRTNRTNGQATASDSLKSFNSNGFTLGKDSDSQGVNYQNRISGEDHVSFTFRKAKKFFDIVTYSGNGTAGRNISHNLGSVPGMIIVKRTNGSASWYVYHRAMDATAPEDYVMALDLTSGKINSSAAWNDTAPTSTHFTVGDNTNYNASGDTYVAYLFAHNNNDGGFGPDGDQDIIKCGGYTGHASNDIDINLGFEPQWLLVKRTNSSSSPGWWMADIMRGWASAGISRLEAQSTAAEQAAYGSITPTATGFHIPQGNVMNDSGSSTYIYMAIRRGPLNEPENATDVFQPNAYTGAGGSGQTVSLNITPDMVINMSRSTSGDSVALNDRLRGSGKELYTSGTGGESSYPSQGMQLDHTNGLRTQSYRDTNNATYLNLCWKRAPSYFDIVAYTGTGSTRTVSHKLGVTPEMMWVKRRDGVGQWNVYHKNLDASNPGHKYIILNSHIAAGDSDSIWNDTSPTSSSFTVADADSVNASGGTFIAYLFASVDGISKVGSFSHTNGSDTNVDCGFSNGARFILYKRSDGSHRWRVFDSVRGIVSGGDPFLELDDAGGETTGDYVDPLSSGFTVTNNNDTGSYIFYAIA
jgi:hypothetical protein